MLKDMANMSSAHLNIRYFRTVTSPLSNYPIYFFVLTYKILKDRITHHPVHINLFRLRVYLVVRNSNRLINVYYNLLGQHCID